MRGAKLALVTTTTALNGLYSPEDVAVDAAGGVYVLDNSGFGQVVESAAS